MTAQDLKATNMLSFRKAKREEYQSLPFSTVWHHSLC